MDSAPEAAQNAGTGRQPPQDGTGFAGINELGGRTGVRAERDVRENVNQEGNRQQSRAESYHSAGSAQRDERVAELERQVAALCRERELRGPPPYERPRPAGMDHSAVPCASGSARAHPYAPSPQVFGSTSKAPHVQVGRPTGEPQGPRARFDETPEPPGVYRAARLSPAYLSPDESIWDQSYLSKDCSK